MEPATTPLINKSPISAKHPPILIKMTPDGSTAIAQMDPGFREFAARDLAKIYPFFKGDAGIYFCRDPKSGQAVSVDDGSARELAAKIGAYQWTTLFNLMQYLFVHQSGPKKGSQKTSVVLSLHDGSTRTFHDLDTATSFLFEMQGEWEEWGKKGA